MKWFLLPGLCWLCYMAGNSNNVPAGVAPVDRSIRTDGMYNMLDTTLLPSGQPAMEHYTTQGLVVFATDTTLYRDNGVTIDSLPFNCRYYQLYNRKADGEYYIKGDSVFATVATTFVVGARYRSFLAHFRGYIKNRDTITDWKVVPPYPKKVTRRATNAVENKDLFAPQVMYFIPTDAVKCLQ